MAGASAAGASATVAAAAVVSAAAAAAAAVAAASAIAVAAGVESCAGGTRTTTEPAVFEGDGHAPTEAVRVPLCRCDLSWSWRSGKCLIGESRSSFHFGATALHYIGFEKVSIPAEESVAFDKKNSSGYPLNILFMCFNNFPSE